MKEKVVAIWKLDDVYLAGQEIDLTSFPGQDILWFALTEKQKWFGVFGDLDLSAWIDANSTIDSAFVAQIDDLPTHWKQFITLAQAGKFPDPITGTDPFKQVKTGPICTCDSLELFRFGCPSARGKTCRSR